MGPWRASTTNRVIVPARQAGNRFLGSLKGLQIRALGVIGRRKIRPIEDNAKCRHLKKLTCKGTLPAGVTLSEAQKPIPYPLTRRKRATGQFLDDILLWCLYSLLVHG